MATVYIHIDDELAGVQWTIQFRLKNISYDGHMFLLLRTMKGGSIEGNSRVAYKGTIRFRAE
jgi:hypothetical protein